MSQKRIFKFVIIAFLFYFFMNFPQNSYAKTNSREVTSATATVWASRSEDQKRNLLYGYMIGSNFICQLYADDKEEDCIKTFSYIDISSTIQLLDWCYTEENAINVNIGLAITIINNETPLDAKRKLRETSDRDAK